MYLLYRRGNVVTNWRATPVYHRNSYYITEHFMGTHDTRLSDPHMYHGQSMVHGLWSSHHYDRNSKIMGILSPTNGSMTIPRKTRTSTLTMAHHGTSWHIMAHHGTYDLRCRLCSSNWAPNATCRTAGCANNNTRKPLKLLCIDHLRTKNGATDGVSDNPISVLVAK